MDNNKTTVNDRTQPAKVTDRKKVMEHAWSRMISFHRKAHDTQLSVTDAYIISTQKKNRNLDTPIANSRDPLRQLHLRLLEGIPFPVERNVLKVILLLGE